MLVFVLAGFFTVFGRLQCIYVSFVCSAVVCLLIVVF